MNKQNILVVGCGGIGCELVKLLSNMNYNRLTFVDLDRIELSNLNRQFFFTANDIKKFKAEVIAEKYKKQHKMVEIEYKTENIYNFDIEFFRHFDFVFNCLDNNEARSYVNLRCIFVGIPFVDGGSTGFLGQSLYFDANSECFDCVKRGNNKIIPVCTIRTLPTEFIHCVIWAKEYFLEELNRIKPILEIRERFEPSNKESIDAENNLIDNDNFENPSNDKNFNDDHGRRDNSNKINSIEKLQNKKIKIDDKVQNKIECVNNNELKKEIYHIDTYKSKFSETILFKEIHKEGHTIFNEDVENLNKIVKLILKRELIKFDKDDSEILKLVYLCAKIRAISYGIDIKTLFETKQIAGNIIPSLCTTNSIVASLMIKSAMKKHNFYIHNSKKGLIELDVADKSLDCFICGKRKYIFTANNNILLKDIFTFLYGFFGHIKLIYTENTIIYNKLNGSIKENEKLDILNNEYFFVETKKEKILVYSYIKDGLDTKLIEII